ncbi:peroxiredoxin family protein [Bernardetia sp.]|uniref:peroxiredoxin family protein n=1 Tax=Bernardetia sp. TaxID=1937974 RepID=UPI0025C5233E|nr:redoxin domain-containing protein [Bernardetia sp.]
MSLPCNALAQFSTILEGKISPVASYEVVIEYQYQYLTYQPKRQLLTTNDKGEFNFNIPLKKSTWLTWKCKDKKGQIYLHVGDSLNMQIDIGKPFSKVKFSGLGASENNFLWQWEAEFGQTSKNALYPRKYKELKEKNFKNEVEKLRKNQYKLLEEAIGKKPLSDDFILALEHRIAYENANHLAEYPVLHAYLNKQKPQNMSSSYYSFFEEIVIQTPSALNQTAYLRFLRNYLEFRYTQYHNENYLKAYSNLYYPLLFEIVEKELQESVQAHAQAILLLELMGKGDKKLYKKYYQKYIKQHKEDKSAPVVREFFEKSEKISYGKTAPNFLLQDMTNKNVQLSDFKGKVVYLFFSPLEGFVLNNYLEGFEYLTNQLSRENKQNKVAFLWIQTEASNISDTEKEKMGEKCDKLNIIRLPCYFLDTLGYNIHTLPIAFLIDKEGKIAYSTTKLPTDAGLLEDIDYLTKK